MLTHLVTLTLRVDGRPAREAGFFLADPLRHIESTSVIPLAVFEQIEEGLRSGRTSGRVALSRRSCEKALEGSWIAERLPALHDVAARYARALAAVSRDFEGYTGMTGGAAVKLAFGPDLVIPIHECRTLLARAVMRGEAPEIIPWLDVQRALSDC